MQASNLELKIPEQNNNKSANDLSIDAITTWCSHLQQIADNNEITQSIITMLKDLNSTAINIEHRFQALEMLRPITHNIYQSQKKQYINRIKPLSANKINSIELSRIIQNELLIGYKIIIQELAHQADLAAKKDLLQNSVYQAFDISNNILLSYYQLYAAEPANIWKELYAIYQYAEYCNILENSITISTNNKKIPITHPYKKLLFLAAIHPYQWRQNEQELLYKYTDIWNELIIIRDFKSKDQSEDEGIFFIPDTQDCAPFPINTNKTTVQEPGIVLDLSKLIAHLKNNNAIDPNETAISKHGLQKLISYLIAVPKRNLERFNILGQISATFGLLSTHYHINKKKTFKPEQVDSKEEDSNIQEFQLSTDAILEDFATSNNEKEFKADTFLYSCNLLNIHGEGAAVSFKDMSYPPIQPGELFAMTINIKDELDLDETHWNIGTVRWLKHDAQHKLTAGLQILAPFAMAAGVQLLKKDGNPSGYFQRALLFKDNNEDCFHLITPIMQFEVNKQVKIYSYYHKEFIDVELKKQIDSDSYFKHFIIYPKFTNRSEKTL